MLNINGRQDLVRVDALKLPMKLDVDGGALSNG